MVDAGVEAGAADAAADAGELRADVVVVGAGPGGLTAALYLARFKRSVLVVDAGHSRAARIPRSRNYPGFVGGVVGAELIAAMREQASQHGARLEVGEVDGIEALPGGFGVHWKGGRARAPLVLLAAGVSDVEPELPHLAQALREGVLRYCPVCDGYEAIDQAVGVIADSATDLTEALYLRHFTDCVTLFSVSKDVRWSSADRRRLREAGITLVDRGVDSLRLWEGRITVRHGDDETSCDSLYCALGLRVHSSLASALGARCDRQGYVLTDRRQRTSVDGLYAVGDVCKGLNQITVATGGAAVAASAMHLALGALG